MQLIPLFLIAVILSGCSAADNLQGMFEKQQAVTADVDKALGVSSQIGWNWHNGTLTDVTVAIPAPKVTGTTVSELTEVIEPIIDKHFEKKPRVLYVAVTVTYE